MMGSLPSCTRKIAEKKGPADSGQINGHEYVDLGLSVKWATSNVGASSPSDYGNYYAWGEIFTKSEYTEDNSKTYGRNMGDIGCNKTFDAARADWGGTWRLPTESELEELVKKCRWTRMTMDGKDGCCVTGPNGNSIFLPAAGWRSEALLKFEGAGGGLWCSTPYKNNVNRAFYLYFDSSYRTVIWSYRDNGHSVRPVTE